LAGLYRVHWREPMFYVENVWICLEGAVRG
jgi:hypothetical protein